jgi:hypothetical protein
MYDANNNATGVAAYLDYANNPNSLSLSKVTTNNIPVNKMATSVRWNIGQSSGGERVEQLEGDVEVLIHGTSSCGRSTVPSSGN